MKIKISANGQEVIAVLDDTPTSRDFASLLPLKLTLEDYNGTEKVNTLSKRLTKEGAPSAVTPKAGDIAFYAPWGNLAIFYQDFERSPGLIKLGRIETGLDALAVEGSIEATIEIMDDKGE